MNLYKHARKYIDVKDLRRLSKEKIKKRNIAEKKKQQEIILDELKKNEMKTSPKFSNWRRELREFGEWAPIETSGPTNSTSTTFGYFVGGSPAVNYETGQQITFTYSGLDGIENYPSTITIDQGFGEVHTTNAPPFGQLGVQGYAAKLNPKYKAAQENYDKKMAEFRKKQDEQMEKIKNTLINLGTSWEELRASWKWVKELGDGTFVAIMPTSPNVDVMNWTDNVRIVKVKQAANADPMYIDYNTKKIDPLTGKKYPWMIHNIEIQSDVYLKVGERPKPPTEQEYLMPRRTDFKDVNPQLDASQEFAQQVGADYMMNARVMTTDMDKSMDGWARFMDAWARRWGGTKGPNSPNVAAGPGAPGTGAEGQWWMSMGRLMDAGISYNDALRQVGPIAGQPSFNYDPSKTPFDADYMMNARVQDTPEQPSFKYDPSKMEREVAQVVSTDLTDPNVVTPDDEAYIDYMERYPGIVNFLFPGQGAAATSVIDYARGNYKNITQSPGRSANQSILKIISRVHQPGNSSGSITAGSPEKPLSYNINKAYPTDPINTVLDAPMRNFLNQFRYEITPNGVRIIDTFNFNDNRSTGGLADIPIIGPDGKMTRIQDVADRLATIGDKRARSNGLDPSDDSFGAKIDFTIPWSEVPAKLQNKLDPNQRTVPIVKKKKKP